MSGNIEVSKYVNKLLSNIAKNDGGKNKKEIDSAKGYEQLCNLLSGNNIPADLELTETERAYINILKTQYEEKYIPQNMRKKETEPFGNGSFIITPFNNPFPNFPVPKETEKPNTIEFYDI